MSCLLWKENYICCVNLSYYKVNTLLKMYMSKPPICLHDDPLSLSDSSCLMELVINNVGSWGKSSPVASKLNASHYVNALVFFSSVHEIFIYFCHIDHLQCCSGMICQNSLFSVAFFHKSKRSAYFPVFAAHLENQFCCPSGQNYNKETTASQSNTKRKLMYCRL